VLQQAYLSSTCDTHNSRAPSQVNCITRELLHVRACVCASHACLLQFHRRCY